ncbi:MAG: glycosyltransferase [Bacteroidia bacterium]|nr:glycosyltransferase [Bacteroidia bacterium]
MTLISRLVFFTEKKTQNKSSCSIKTNEISIVIPVKDNQKGINKYLDSLFQVLSADELPKEIIIVDNNSRNEITLSKKYISSGKVKLIQCKNLGPAAARNHGASIASGEWLLFNDSDCVPSRKILSGFLKADNGSVAYAGNIKSLGKDKLSKYYESQEILIPLKTYNESGDFVPQYLITANTLIWKEAFDEAGGFNESISIAGGEDVDLGLRLSQIGKLSYAFDSIAYHDFNDGIVGFYKRFKRYGYGNRLIEELWKTNMKPEKFYPNEKSFFNNVVATLQFYFLLFGYKKADKDLRRNSVNHK